VQLEEDDILVWDDIALDVLEETLVSEQDWELVVLVEALDSCEVELEQLEDEEKIGEDMLLVVELE
jgi:hypothetical protein